MSNSPKNREQSTLLEQTENQCNPGAARPEDFKIEDRDGGQSSEALLAEADADGKSRLGAPIPERNSIPSRRISDE